MFTSVCKRISPWLLATLLLAPAAANAQSLPKWEIGIGLAAMQLPYYRGSATNRNFLLPFPRLIYRSEKFKIDEKGIKGRLFGSDRIKLDFSLAGGVPVPSEQNGVRADMPDLKPTVEIGPSLQLKLWRAKTHRHALSLVLPLRATFAIDLPSLPHEGWIFSPYLNLTMAQYRRNYWVGDLSIGPIYADAAYHDYFYGVEQQYASASRPAYQGEGGYAGSRLTLLLKRKSGNKMFIIFARFDTLRGAVFESSPLVEAKSYHVVGAAVTWQLASSSERVEAP